MRRLLLLISSLVLFACAQTNKEKIEEAVLSAQNALTTAACDDALATLLAITGANTNAEYVQTLASAYACKAGVTASNFVVNDLTKFGDPVGLGSLTKFTTSPDMVAPDSEKYTALQSAISTLLYAGGIDPTLDPTVIRRAEKFEASDALNINTQLLYYQMIQLGRYLYYYGNADANGVKGFGTGTNKCIVTYDPNLEVNYDSDGSGPLPASSVKFSVYLDVANAAGMIGACSSTESGKLQLGASGSAIPLNISRLCQGVVLLNSFFDVFPAIVDATSDTMFDGFGSSDISTMIDTLKSITTDAKTGMSEVVNTLNYTNCVTNNSTPNTDVFIQIYFGMMFEGLFK